MLNLKMRSAEVFAIIAVAGCSTPDLMPPVDTGHVDARIIWSVEGYRGWGTPAYDDERVYFSTTDHYIVAVDRETGRQVWTTRLPIPLPAYHGSGVVMAGGTVIAGDQDVFGLDPQTGSIRWQFAPTGALNTGLMLPGAAGSNVIVASTSGSLFSVDASTGATKWATRLLGEEDVRVFSPIVIDGEIFVSFTQTFSSTDQQGGVARVGLETGAVIWWRYLPRPSDPARWSSTIEPAVVGDVVVAGSRDGPTFAFQRSSGDLAWTLPPAPELLTGPGAPFQEIAPITSDGKLVFIGSSQGRLRAVDPASGNIVWERPPDRGGIGWLTADSSAVAEVFSNGELQLLTPGAGVLLFRTSPEKTIALFTPMLAEDEVYFSGFRGLFAVRR